MYGTRAEEGDLWWEEGCRRKDGQRRWKWQPRANTMIYMCENVVRSPFLNDTACVWRSEVRGHRTHLWESVLSSYLMGFRHQVQVASPLTSGAVLAQEARYFIHWQNFNTLFKFFVYLFTSYNFFFNSDGVLCSKTELSDWWNVYQIKLTGSINLRWPFGGGSDLQSYSITVLPHNKGVDTLNK